MNQLIDALPQMKKALEGAARRADTLGEFFGNLMAVVQVFTERVEQAKGKLEIK